ncbi:hypothetical protein A8C32_02565 [Flavivirga aquatica]|uniref:GH16 domain-containing protein n=1 Tax=Flavivirga aquatica TaxID=1849968 RepID=A0A1E5TAE3_9FLAO|nr:family 16 glycosylhydrolase [Flavivirga aquatica]OEK08352.1 hypothetical protein A8C32_02565 [Flavivirga aquatica]
MKKNKQGINKVQFLILLIIGLSLQIYAQNPVGISGNWTLQPDFSDEFSGGLDTAKWDHNPNDWGPWSWEPRHTKVRGGNLNLTIDWDKHTRAGKQLYFTSGIIRSRKDIKYGYFEIKMKGNPRHPGACPAFWTYSIGQSTMVINGQRVKYNEIDFPEIQQRRRNVNIIDWNIIRADDARPQKRTTRRVSTGGPNGAPNFDPRNAFHVYGCLWEENSIKFYIDGNLVGTADASESRFQKHKQRLVISLGLREPYYEYVNGGRIATETNARPSGFPSTMEVQYVRTWKRAGGGGGNNNGGNNSGGTNCGATWNPNAKYALKAIVSHNGKKWRWKAKKRGNCTPGACGRWKDLGNCTSNRSTSKNDQTKNNGAENNNSSDFIGNGPIGDEVNNIIGWGPSANIEMSHNSTKNILNIESDGITKISMYNLLGAKVLDQEFQDRTNLNISSLPKGIYIVKISNEVSGITKKISL